MTHDSRIHWSPTLALLAALAGPAAAQDPCTLMPFDGTNENGLGAQPGFVVEYCSEIVVPPVCLDGGNYFINAVQIEATETTGASTMPITAQVRRAFIGAGPMKPNAIVAGPTQDVVQNVPNFPASRRWVTTVLQASGRFSVGLDAVQITSACTILDGSQTPGQFLGTDESAGTAINPCWKGDPPDNPDEDCRNGAPALRALRTGLKVSPHGGMADGSQEVPPVNTAAHGTVRLGPNVPGGLIFWVEIDHDVANPTGAHIHRGAPGMNGPIVRDLGDPTSPIFVPAVDLTDLIDDLFGGELYVNIHSAAFPNGEIRSEILNASNLVFEDGFESGDTTSWSNTVP